MTLLKQLNVCVLGLALSLNAGAAIAEVVPVVSSRSSVSALTNNEVVDIFLGKLSRFPNGEQAVPIDQAEDTPVRDEFYRTFSGRSPAQIRAHWAKIIFTGRGKPPITVESAAEVKKRLAANPNAIGYIDRQYVDDSVRVISTK